MTTTSSPTSAHKLRVQQFIDLLDAKENIDLQKLSKHCFDHGIPDDDSHLRSLTWKLLLGFLPSQKDTWNERISKKRSIYEQFVLELVVNEKNNTQPDDHPLNPSPNSHWNRHFKDNEILSQIFKDVRRLYPDISFFQQRIRKKAILTQNPRGTCDIIGRATTSIMKSSEVVKNYLGISKIKDGNSSCKFVNEIDDGNNYGELIVKDDDNEEFHWQVVARILFVFAKLNPGQNYVQGMNEIIGPIYYVFANDPKIEWSEHCEADTFYCFTQLMSEIRDLYNSQLDSDQSLGVVGMMSRLSNLLAQESSSLHSQLTHLVIKPHYYAFRWITLLLSQEFPLPEVLHIWDYLFADSKRFEFLIKICCAMLLLLQDEIMNGDFARNMKLLQNFPERIEVRTVICRAKQIIRPVL